MKDVKSIFGLLDEVIEEIREHLVDQIVIDNNNTFRTIRNKLIEKTKHL